MHSILPLAIFAARATAQLTTALWYIGDSNVNASAETFVGSVVALNNDRTTVAIIVVPLSGVTPTISPTPDTITIGGLTYGGFTITEVGNDHPAPQTEYMQCSRANTEDAANATCTFSAISAKESLREDCSRYSKSEILTETYTITRTRFPSRSATSTQVTTRTQTSTLNYASAAAPSYCTMSAIPEDAVQDTLTYPGGSGHIMTTYELILTAGLEKLNATTAGSGANAASTAAGATGTSKAAAVPMRTGAPVLVGIGAAVAAFFM